MKLRLFCLLMGLLPLCDLLGQASLSGHISDAKTGEPILFGNVKLYQGGVYQTGVQTDFDGNYSFSPMKAGVYGVEVSYVMYLSKRIENVIVISGQENFLNFSIEKDTFSEEIKDIDYKMPQIETENISTEEELTIEDVKRLPTRSIHGIAASVAGSDGIYFLPSKDDRFLSLMFTIRFDKVMLSSAEGKVVRRLRFKNIGEHQLRIDRLDPGEYTIIGFSTGREFRLPFEVTVN